MNTKKSKTVLRLMIGLLLLLTIVWAVPAVAEVVIYGENYVVEYVGDGTVAGPRVRYCAPVVYRPTKDIKVGMRVDHLPDRQATMNTDEGDLYLYEDVWYKPAMECGRVVWIAIEREYDD